jgi:N-acetylglucosamine-6-phosphate deacetylase
MGENIFIHDCMLAPPYDYHRPLNIIVRDGIIREIGSGLKAASDMPSIDARGHRVAAGFIDLHVQGAGGADVLDGSEESLRIIARTCARYGVTGFLATSVYRRDGDNLHLRSAARMVGENTGGAQLLGIHLEGPFISPERRGMIQPDSICPSSSEEMRKILELTSGTLRMMTIAPEPDGNLGLIADLVRSGTVASFGHSAATYEQTLAGIRAGISHATHLFNAMPSLHHRDAGPLGALQKSDVSVQIIPDGVHVHPAVLELACRIFGAGRINTITDGMQAMGLSDGDYVYNGIAYRAEDGTARYRDGTLIGTALGMSEMVSRLQLLAHLSTAQALETATINPARVLGMETERGSIAPGKRGDLVLLDDDFSVLTTVVSGKVVYQG